MKQNNSSNNNSFSINFNGDVINSSIQQNTVKSTQITYVTYDYEEVLHIIQEIEKYTSLDDFNTDFGDNSQLVKDKINEIYLMLKNKENPTIINKSLIVIKDLSIGVTGSLIASGIISLITSFLGG